MSGEDAGRAALDGVDKVLAGRPHKDDYVLSDTVKAVCAYRETLIAQAGDLSHDGEGRRRLERLNGVLAVVLAAYYPLGETPWDELSKARTWLAELLADRTPA